MNWWIACDVNFPTEVPSFFWFQGNTSSTCTPRSMASCHLTVKMWWPNSWQPWWYQQFPWLEKKTLCSGEASSLMAWFFVFKDSETTVLQYKKHFLGVSCPAFLADYKDSESWCEMLVLGEKNVGISSAIPQGGSMKCRTYHRTVERIEVDSKEWMGSHWIKSILHYAFWLHLQVLIKDSFYPKIWGWYSCFPEWPKSSTKCWSFVGFWTHLKRQLNLDPCSE